VIYRFSSRFPSKHASRQASIVKWYRAIPFIVASDGIQQYTASLYGFNPCIIRFGPSKCLQTSSENSKKALDIIVTGRQRGRVIRVLDLEFVGPGFESHSGHFMDLLHGSPELSNPWAALVNSQLLCLPPFGILNHAMFHFQYLFQLFEWHACKLAALS